MPLACVVQFIKSALNMMKTEYYNRHLSGSYHPFSDQCLFPGEICQTFNDTVEPKSLAAASVGNESIAFNNNFDSRLLSYCHKMFNIIKCRGRQLIAHKMKAHGGLSFLFITKENSIHNSYQLEININILQKPLSS